MGLTKIIFSIKHIFSVKNMFYNLIKYFKNLLKRNNYIFQNLPIN
jgi:hypothetical protein